MLMLMSVGLAQRLTGPASRQVQTSALGRDDHLHARVQTVFNIYSRTNSICEGSLLNMSLPSIAEATCSDGVCFSLVLFSSILHSLVPKWGPTSSLL